MNRAGWRPLVLALWCLMVLLLPGAHIARHRSVVATSRGPRVPILRFAIDNDYYPEKQSAAQAARMGQSGVAWRLGTAIRSAA